MTLPVAVHLTGQPGAVLTRTLHWQVPQGSTLCLPHSLPTRLPAACLEADAPRRTSADGRLPRAGLATGKAVRLALPRLHAMLGTLWQPRQYPVMVQGAVMAFEADHGLTTDGVVENPGVGRPVAGSRPPPGQPPPYDYIEVSEGSPGDGYGGARAHRLSTACNTSIAARPTAFGTFPVYALCLDDDEQHKPRRQPLQRPQGAASPTSTAVTRCTGFCARVRLAGARAVSSCRTTLRPWCSTRPDRHVVGSLEADQAVSGSGSRLGLCFKVRLAHADIGIRSARSPCPGPGETTGRVVTRTGRVPDRRLSRRTGVV